MFFPNMALKTPAQQNDRFHMLALSLILLGGGALRFYDLDTPSLWWDEMIVPLTARFPIQYIWDWAKSCEIHPPYFHYLIKLVLLSGQSDYCLRLLPAIGGMASIVLLYLWGKQLFSSWVGLAAAAILAVAPLQISLSRQVRPYTLFLALFLLSCLHLTAYLKDSRTRNLMFVAFCQLGMTALHFMGLFVLLVQNAVLMANVVSVRDWRQCGWLACSWLVTGAGVLSVWPFLMHTMLDRKDMVGGATLSGVMLDFAEDFLNINRFGNIPVNAVLLFLAMLGSIVAWKLGKKTALFLVSFILLPMGIIIGFKLGWHHPRYIIYMSPVLALLAAKGLDTLPGTWTKSVACPLGICAAGVAFFISSQAQDMYRVDSFPVQDAQYKEFSRYLVQNLGPGDILYADTGLFNSARWYYRQFAQKDYMAGPDARSGQGRRRLMSLNGEWAAPSIRKELGSLASWKLERLQVAQGALDIYDIPRAEPDALDTLPGRKELGCQLGDFYPRVVGWENVVPSYHVPGIHPGEVITPGKFTWEIVNHVSAQPMVIHALIELENQGEGNTASLTWRFDDEEPATQILTNSPEGTIRKVVAFARDNAFSRLSLSFEMTCRPITPRYPGSNVETLLFRKCVLYVCPTGDTPLCETMMVVDNLPTGLEYSQPVSQARIHLESVLDEAADSPGWRVYKPARQGVEGLIRVELTPSVLDQVYYYPRVVGNSSQLEVYSVEDGRREFVSMIQGLDKLWTPVGLRYPLRFQGAPKALEIVLRGASAQVWHKNGQILFR